jgi:tetratricopeptide (TPR) repeat protein
MYQGNIPAALEAATRAEEVARSIGADLELSRTLALQGRVRFQFGDPDAALKLVEEALALARKIGDETQIASGLNFLGGINFMLGRYDAASSYLEEALKMFQERGSRETLDVLNNLGVIAEALGDYHIALERYQTALITAQETGKRNKEIQFLTNVGTARVRLGAFGDAEADLMGAINLVANAQVGMLSEPYRLLAEAYLGQGKLEEAFETARHALGLGQEFEALDNIAGAWRVLGMIAAATGDPITIEGDSPQICDAAMCFEKSLQTYRKLKMEGEQAWTLRAWARFELEQGDRTRGEEMWKQAREIFERLGAKLEAERMAALPTAGR